MSSEPATPRRPTLAVVTIGHYRHGKTTLTAALLKVLAGRPGATARPVSVHDLDRRAGACALISDHDTRTVVAGYLRYATDHRSFIHADCPGHRPWLKNAARAQALADAAVLVVSAPDSVQHQTHEHLLLARALGLRQLVVFISKCDEVQDLEWVDLVERDIRDLLDRCGFDGNGTRILRGAALPVLRGDSPWEASIRDLVEALEQDLAVPAHDAAAAPLLYIHGAHNSVQFPRDVIVEGRLRRGTLRLQDKLTLVGMGDPIQVRVEDLEVARAKTPQAEAGERVGLQLRSIERALRRYDITSGQALIAREAPPTTVQEFPARIQLLPTAERGRTSGIRNNHAALCVFGTAVMAGRIQLPQHVVLAPGESAEVSITLNRPLYIEPGMPFLLRDGNQCAEWKRGAPARWAGTAGSGEVLARRLP